MKIATRTAFGEALVELAEKYPEIVTIDADLAGSLKTGAFAKAHPERAFNVGIAEQNLIGTAAGLALAGKIPFACSFAVFSTGRPWEQIRNSVAYPKLNVKIVGSHAGILTGEDGATHQALEDLALMRVLPNMQVFCPADANETKAVMREIVKIKGPCYLRLGREGVPLIYPENYKFTVGKGDLLQTGTKATLIATGSVVGYALQAVLKLKNEDGIEIELINMASIKPIDEDLIVKSAQKTGLVITAEDHQIAGGLGGAVAEVLAEKYPARLYRIGMQDQFGESGTPEDLYAKYGFDAEGIYGKLKEILKK